MLELQFILTFQNTDYIVDEPDGFTSFNSVLERDFDTHGVFFRFTDNDLKLKFPGSGRDVLKSARDGFGIDASVGLTVKRKFRSTDTFVTIYTGNAVMENLEITREYASVDFEELNTMIKIKDRLDVPVRSTQTTDFDGNAISAATETAFTMGAKTIQQVSSGLVDGVDAEPEPALNIPYIEIGNIPSTTGLQIEGVEDTDFILSQEKNEIEFQNENPAFVTGPNEIEAGGDPSYLFMGGRLNAYVGKYPYTFTFSVTGNLQVVNNGINGGRGEVIFYREEYTEQDDGTFLNTSTFAVKTFSLGSLPPGGSSTLEFDYSEDNSITDRAMYWRMRIFVQDTGPGTTAQDIQLRVQPANEDPSFRVSGSIDTSEPDTDVNGYFLHEALRHNVQVVAGQDMLYAPFFGRTADGYDENGCAWNYTESNGWRIRGFSNALNMALKTRLNSLKAIFGVGYGLERVAEASETYRFRVDQYEYWYNENLLYEFDDVVDYKEEFFDWFSFNEVEVGYKKYSNDEDEPGTTEDFNSSASWLMPVERLRGKKSFLSDYIGSDLLAEITRRLQFEEKPTTSNRYDDDIFLQEVKSDGSGGWEIGGQGGSPLQIIVDGNINPLFNTIINPRFNFFNQSPIVNSVAYKKLITDEYKNTSYKYGGDLKIYYSNLSTTDNCLGDLTEGSPGLANLQPAQEDDITLSRFRDGQRLFDPIKVSFKAALSTEQIEDIIEAHRNGLSAGTQYFTIDHNASSGFEVGQTVTGNPSGAEGVITAINSTSDMLVRLVGLTEFEVGDLMVSDTDSANITGIVFSHIDPPVEGNNYGFIRITNPDGEQIEGWLLKLSFNFADQIGNFELIKKANAYSI